MSRLNTDDANEFQEVKRRLKRNADKKANFRTLLLFVAIVAVFQLGIAAGIIITTQKGRKIQAGTDSRGTPVTAQVTQRPVAGTPADPTPPVNAPAVDKAVATTSKTKTTQQPVKRQENKQRALPEKRPEKRNVTQKQRNKMASPVWRPVRAAAFPLSIDVAGGDIGRAYAAGMRTIIERHKETPIGLNGTPLEGRCLIVCIIRRDGSLKHAEVIRTSGNAVLDAAALRSVHKAGKFPAVPDEIPGDVLSFDVPLAFRMDRMSVKYN